MSLRHSVARTVGPLLALALASAGAGRAATIELAERAQVAGTDIRLGHLGAVRGPADEAEALRTVIIGPAPLPGGERTLSVGYLKLRLRRAGINCNSVRFTGAAQVLVSRPPALRPAEAISPIAAGLGEIANPTPGPVVPRGSAVRLVLDWGALRVTADATTLDPAAVGAFVRLRLAHGGETVTARLVALGEALITRMEASP